MDTNIYLSFYSLSSDDLEELKKIAVLSLNKEIILHLPAQTKTEYYRNRENKINQTVTKMKERNFAIQFPQITRNYKEYEEMRKLLKETQRLRILLEESLNNDIYNNSLKADQLIEQIFLSAKIQNESKVILEKAKLNFDIWNPPGKNHSYWDAIIRESLKMSVDKNDGPLYFIWGDKDFISPLDNNRFNLFLESERKEEKWCEIIFYRNLTDFFSAKFPKIKLASELHKRITLTNFINSPHFIATRQNLRKLQYINEFTDDEIRDIVDAAITNNQIYWINTDEDIQTMLFQIVENRLNIVDADSAEEFLNLYDQERISERERREYEEDERETRKLLFPKEDVF